MDRLEAVFLESGAPRPLRIAARRLEEDLGIPLSESPVGNGIRLAVDAALPENSFSIRREKGLLFSGDTPRTVLAGVLYFLHHRKLGRELELPLICTSPFPERLVMEDFPFMCYWPTGFEFDLDTYAENLVALGFTAMECNRLSRRQPMEPFHWNYAFTNPSPASFVWTPWHGGVWDSEVIEANAREFRRTVDAALEYGLSPTMTTFFPRPYPEPFFARHPHLRGEKFQNEHMLETGHPPLYRLDTDHPDARKFLGTLYGGLFDRFPELGNLFFWHGDLGSGFSSDRKNGSGAVQRMAGFHRMVQSLLKERGMKSKVWMNPWHLDEREFQELDLLPPEVGFSVKDNVGIRLGEGNLEILLPDATIVTSEIGPAFRDVSDLAAKTGRRVCMAQYQDFSEDLDPVIAVPHPVMTFRKLEKLMEIAPDSSSVNWGLVSPDVAPVNVNQNMIREFTWNGGDFETLLPRLLPAGFSAEQTALVQEAWRQLDQALQGWPQFWGLRLQDSGMRLRWLVKPFGFGEEANAEELFSFWLDRQIYRDPAPSPLDAFMELAPAQAIGVSERYAGMIGLVSRARKLLQETDSDWLSAQVASLQTLELFWTTYRNLLGFWGHRLSGKEELCDGFVQDERRNLDATIGHLARHPETIVVTRNGAWGQCFGADYFEEFQKKKEIMEKF